MLAAREPVTSRDVLEAWEAETGVEGPQFVTPRVLIWWEVVAPWLLVRRRPPPSPLLPALAVSGAEGAVSPGPTLAAVFAWGSPSRHLLETDLICGIHPTSLNLFGRVMSAPMAGEARAKEPAISDG